MLRSLKLVILLFVLLGLTSCREYYFHADLLITVKSWVTGNPKEGLPVQVFETRQDAEQLVYPVTPVVYTDMFGEVAIYGLEPGYEYFVRVDALLITKIKDTKTLRDGVNNCTVRML